MKNKIKKYFVLLTIVSSLVVSSCTIVDPAPNNGGGAIDKALSDGLKSNRQLESSAKKLPNELPLSVQNALMPEINVLGPHNGEIFTKNTEQKFDIAVNNVAAKDFFVGLVKGTDYNMTVNPKIDGNISLSLKSVTVPQVMDAVRDIYGFEYEKRSYGYTVFPRRLETRIFNVDYLDVDRDGQSQTTIGSGQITSTVQNTLTSSGVSSSESSGSTPSGVVRTTSNSKFWDLMKENLETIVGTQEGRSIVLNPKSGIIIIKAYPNELRYVGQYLDKIQNVVHRQVIIEAKILEIELKAQFQSGINWKVLGLHQGFKYSEAITPGGDVSNSILSSAELPNTFGSVFKLDATSGNSFNTLVNLLNDQGNVNVLSSPRVATINNQKAVIKVGSDRFFVTKVSSDTNNSGSNTSTTSDITLTPFFSGISLDVTPQIDSDNNVTMHIHPIISKVVKDQESFKVNDKEQNLPLATSTIRESDSVVRAKNGQVIVIGGLMESSGGDYSASTPGADRLPGVSGLFKSRNKTSRKFELVILLRPIISESTKTWQQQLNEAAASVKKLNVMGKDFSYKIEPMKRKN